MEIIEEHRGKPILVENTGLSKNLTLPLTQIFICVFEKNDEIKTP